MSGRICGWRVERRVEDGVEGIGGRGESLTGVGRCSRNRLDKSARLGIKTGATLKTNVESYLGTL